MQQIQNFVIYAKYYTTLICDNLTGKNKNTYNHILLYSKLQVDLCERSLMRVEYPYNVHTNLDQKNDELKKIFYIQMKNYKKSIQQYNIYSQLNYIDIIIKNNIALDENLNRISKEESAFNKDSTTKKEYILFNDKVKPIDLCRRYAEENGYMYQIFNDEYCKIFMQK